MQARWRKTQAHGRHTTGAPCSGSAAAAPRRFLWLYPCWSPPLMSSEVR